MRPQTSMGLGEKRLFCSKQKDQATCYSPTEAWVMPAPSSKKPEEREFVVNSGASMHMLSRKGPSSDEQETLRTSKNPTTVITANGRVQTHEEAEVHVHDLDLDLRQVLRGARLFPQVQKPHLTKECEK